MKPSDSTRRFSHTVEHYINYRPSYPEAIIHFMETKLGLTKDSIIADIGSGTGKLAAIFVKNHPQHTEAIRALHRIFDQFEEKETVKMWYRTEVYYN